MQAGPQSSFHREVAFMELEKEADSPVRAFRKQEMMLNVPSLPLQSFSPAQLPEAHKSCHFLLLKHSSLEVFASPFKI